MPSRSTNLNAPSNNSTKKQKPDKRKRAADAAAAEAAAPKKVKVDEPTSSSTAEGTSAEVSGSAVVKGEEGALSSAGLKKEKKEVSPPKPTEVNGEFLPSKEDIENDKEISEGARLALLYATLYLRFNPSPTYRPVPTKASKSMKANHPLPADPWAAQHQNPLFQSDFTPTDAAFELTAKQYADKKKAFRDGKAKKGDGVTGERWKFNKAREGWLLRWACDEGQLPTRYFNTAIAYLTSVKAPAAREQLTETATAALAVDNEEKQRRAKKVLKMLGKPVEGDESDEEVAAQDEEEEAEEGVDVPTAAAAEDGEDESDDGSDDEEASDE